MDDVTFALQDWSVLVYVKKKHKSYFCKIFKSAKTICSSSNRPCFGAEPNFCLIFACIVSFGMSSRYACIMNWYMGSKKSGNFDSKTRKWASIPPNPALASWRKWPCLTSPLMIGIGSENSSSDARLAGGALQHEFFKRNIDEAWTWVTWSRKQACRARWS